MKSRLTLPLISKIKCQLLIQQGISKKLTKHRLFKFAAVKQSQISKVPSKNSLRTHQTLVLKTLVKLFFALNSIFSDIKFYNYGLQGFEVVDDGTGVKEVDFDIIAKRGTTSKITEFEDIYAVRTMGFRGEALSSICNIANLTL